jgi:NYN domain
VGRSDSPSPIAERGSATESDTPPARVWVFVDYMNVYNDARRAFHSGSGPSWFGQIAPNRLGEVLSSGGPQQGTSRKLERVMVYRGLPSSKRESKGYGAARRQVATWEASGVRVFTRPLRYPLKWPADPAEEKGIDVALAVDLVYNGVRKYYDIAVVCSTDTDLVPALEAVCDQTRAWGTPRVEVMSWESKQTKKRLRVDGVSIWCHWLGQDQYDAVSDRTDYNVPSGS